MNRLRGIYVIVCLLVVTLISTAAVAPSTMAPTANQVAVAEMENAIKNNKLGQLIEQTTGQKLSLKEKIALKIFGKKIQTISKTKDATAPKGDKSQTIAFILCWFLGSLGIHRFYLGYTWQGVVQLLTLGGCGIWVLIDWIRIIIGDLQPKGGSYNPAWGKV
jgi:TM2 domain-containing membrane protein YozV